ncbi:hypothetical protein OZ698_000766 [Yersinia enterocolitica]|nr:hypothetical protein [Yersinia enterocolitica]
MNNIEERIEFLKASVALSDLIGPDELTVTVSDLEALIAQLEAAQKEIHDLKMKLSDAGCLLVEWKHRVEKAEAALSAANEKLSKPVSIWKLNNFREAPAGGIEWAKGYVVANNRAVKAISDAGFTVEE